MQRTKRLTKRDLLLPLVACMLCLPLPHLAADSEDADVEQMLTIGETEYIYIQESDFAYDSRIDTGATTCSIHAEEITPFERDGEQWVTFKLVNFKTDERIEIEKPVTREVSIKRHGSDAQERYVVSLGVKIRDAMVKTEFSLTDRSDYSYPLLVGRNMLRGIAVVDVSQSYLMGREAKKTAKPKGK